MYYICQSVVTYCGTLVGSPSIVDHQMDKMLKYQKKKHLRMVVTVRWMSGCMYGLKNEVGGQYEGNLGPKNIYLWSLKATTTSNMTDNGSITDLQMLNVI
jgi:hypothetical protein